MVIHLLKNNTCHFEPWFLQGTTIRLIRDNFSLRSELRLRRNLSNTAEYSDTCRDVEPLLQVKICYVQINLFLSRRLDFIWPVGEVGWIPWEAHLLLQSPPIRRREWSSGVIKGRRRWLARDGTWRAILPSINPSCQLNQKRLDLLNKIFSFEKGSSFLLTCQYVGKIGTWCECGSLFLMVWSRHDDSLLIIDQSSRKVSWKNKNKVKVNLS